MTQRNLMKTIPKIRGEGKSALQGKNVTSNTVLI